MEKMNFEMKKIGLVQDGNIALCEKCGTPVEGVFEFDGEKRVFPTICKCRQEKLDEEKRVLHQAEIEENRHRALKNKNHIDRTFKNADNRNKDVKEKLMKYCDKIEERFIDGIGIMLYGNYGVGKTYFAHCVLNKLLDDAILCSATSMNEVISMAQNFDKFDAWYRSIMRSKVIMIDDFGTQRTTSFAWEKAYEFINDCVENKKIMIITSNLTVAEMEDKAKSEDMNEGRIYSRVLGSCAKLLVKGEDRRTKRKLEAVFD